MKKSLKHLIVFWVVVVIFSLLVVAPPAAILYLKKLPPITEQQQDEDLVPDVPNRYREGLVHVPYITPDGLPVILEFDPTIKSVAITARASAGFVFGDSKDENVLSLMKKEVTRLTTTTESIPLGEGYSFRFLGGHTMVAAFGLTNTKSGIYHRLFFVDDVTLVDGVIIARGFGQSQK
jgi:hypothetical protein